MKRRALRIAVLLWLGWYLSGPVCETIDFWDPPRAEAHDIERNAGGAAALVAVIFCFAVFLIRQWRKRCCFLPGALRGFFLPIIAFRRVLALPATIACSHSPPLSPLRI